jgi:hypothetical protein
MIGISCTLTPLTAQTPPYRPEAPLTSEVAPPKEGTVNAQLRDISYLISPGTSDKDLEDALTQLDLILSDKSLPQKIQPRQYGDPLSRLLNRLGRLVQEDMGEGNMHLLDTYGEVLRLDGLRSIGRDPNTGATPELGLLAGLIHLDRSPDYNRKTLEILEKFPCRWTLYTLLHLFIKEGGLELFIEEGGPAPKAPALTLTLEIYDAMIKTAVNLRPRDRIDPDSMLLCLLDTKRRTPDSHTIKYAPIFALDLSTEGDIDFPYTLEHIIPPEYAALMIGALPLERAIPLIPSLEETMRTTGGKRAALAAQSLGMIVERMPANDPEARAATTAITEYKTRRAHSNLMLLIGLGTTGVIILVVPLLIAWLKSRREKNTHDTTPPTPTLRKPPQRQRSEIA